MPTLPVYNSRENLRTGAPAPLRNEATQAFADNEKIIGTVQEITQAWSNAHDVMQYTNAKVSYETAAAKIRANALADTGIAQDDNGNPTFKDNSEIYVKQLQEAKKNAARNISNQMVAGKIKAELDIEATKTSFDISGNFNKKMIEFNRGQIPSFLDAEVSKILAGSENDKMLAKAAINDFLSMQVNIGAITPAEASKFLKNSQETVVKYEVYNDNSTQEKESDLLRELKKADGKYSFLAPDTRLKMIEESQRRIFQNNQTFKREAEASRNERFNDVFTKANEGTLTLNDLDAEMAIPEEAGGIPKKQLLEIRKAIQSKIKTDLEIITKDNDKAYEYKEFVDNFISDETDRQKGREAIVNAFKDGILSPKEASFLNSLKREAEGIQQLRSREEFMGESMIPFKNAINFVNDFFTGKKSFTESDKALAIKKILNKSANGDDPIKVSQEIIKESIINKNPDILGFNPNGQLTADENGYIKMMNNKGDSWNIEEEFKKAKEQ